MKFILLINVKMPTMLINVKMSRIAGILTFISRINDWLLCFKHMKFPLILAISVVMSSLNFMLSRVEHEKSL